MVDDSPSSTSTHKGKGEGDWTSRTRRGAKRDGPGQLNASSSAAATSSTNIRLPAPITATRFDAKAGKHYPSITSTAIRTLKWGDARELLLPFLSEDEKANIHKKTRADIAKLLEKRITAGEVTPEQFWAVAGTDKVQQQKKKRKPMDPVVAEALLKNKILPPPEKPSPTQKGPVPIVPGIPHPRPTPMVAGGSPTAASTLTPRGPMPFLPPPRADYKYTLRVPASIWPSTKYPPGTVIGGPSPPSSLFISGIFYSSAFLSLGPDDKVYYFNDSKKQAQYIFSRLDLVLSQLKASRSDVLSITAHVVNIHKNGEDVMDAYCEYMAGNGTATRSFCAWTMIGVSGLMPKGCVVQLEVKAIVRRGVASNLMLERPPVTV
ncbi:hypothetical protein ACHAXR_006259 [Thalassiosira sp. AJA248-18]